MAETTPAYDGPRTAPHNGGEPQRLVIFLHGVGADGNDLIQLAPLLQDVLPDAAFVSPHAPDPFDFAPMGRQWFSFRDGDPAAIAQEGRRAGGYVDRILDDEMARAGLPPEKVALVGFSQGGMVALQSALRRSRPVACVVGLSTMLVDAETLPGEIASRPPVLMANGDQDTVLPIDQFRQSVQVLQALGVPVTSHVLTGRGHEIDQEGLELVRDFLKRHLAGA